MRSLGWGAVHITASDIDPEAVTQCQVTLLANGCSHAVVRAAQVLIPLREGKACRIIGNTMKVIINCWADVICEVMTDQRWPSVIAPGADIVVAGIAGAAWPDCQEVFAAQSLRQQAQLDDGWWYAAHITELNIVVLSRNELSMTVPSTRRAAVRGDDHSRYPRCGCDSAPTSHQCSLPVTGLAA